MPHDSVLLVVSLTFSVILRSEVIFRFSVVFRSSILLLTTAPHIVAKRPKLFVTFDQLGSVTFNLSLENPM